MSSSGAVKFKTFRCLKTKFKTITTTQGNTFTIDLFKILLGSKICGGLKPPKFLGCCGPGISNVKQKDNGMNQSTPLWSLCEYELANLIK